MYLWMNKEKEMTQKEQVLQHLKKNGTITSWDAIMEYGITRLSGVVYKLKKDGHKITTKTIVKKKGERTITFAEYRLRND